jgi:hypothetical protein
MILDRMAYWTDRLAAGIARHGTRRILAAAAIGFLAVLVLGIVKGDIQGVFEEDNPGTGLSELLLLATALISFAIFLRRRGDGPLWSSSSLIWLLISAGFIFLWLDEAFEFHEGVDRAFHALLRVQQTALTDRIDDIIILVYGMIGAFVLFRYRREILKIDGLTTFLGLGMALLVLQVGIDVLSNGDEYVGWLGLDDTAAARMKTVLHVFEDAAKIAAEAVFLAGFAHAYRSVSASGTT